VLIVPFAYMPLPVAGRSRGVPSARGNRRDHLHDRLPV